MTSVTSKSFSYPETQTGVGETQPNLVKVCFRGTLQSYINGGGGCFT